MSDGDEDGYGRRWCDIARRTGRSIVRRRRGGGGQFKAGNDDDDVASFSKKIQDKGLNSCLTAATGRMFPIPGAQLTENKRKKQASAFVQVFVQLCSNCGVESVLFFLVFIFLFFSITKEKGWGGECFWSKIEGSGKEIAGVTRFGQLLTKGPVEVQLGGA